MQYDAHVTLVSKFATACATLTWGAGQINDASAREQEPGERSFLACLQLHKSILTLLHGGAPLTVVTAVHIYNVPSKSTGQGWRSASDDGSELCAESALLVLRPQ